MINDGGYDYDASMEALNDDSYDLSTDDISFVLAAYSVSKQQEDTSVSELESILRSAGDLFPVTSVERDMPEVIGATDAEPEKFLECTIHPLDRTAILKAFGLDPLAQYGSYSITNAEAIEHMSVSLAKTLFGSSGSGDGETPAVDGEITHIGKFPIPVVGSSRITSHFGPRPAPTPGASTYHYGIDIAGAHHTQIISIADGTVVQACLAKGNLNIVKIKHKDENGKVFYSRYLHLAEIYVTEGQEVSAEQVIGTEGGAKGEVGAGTSTGPHLHFELRDSNDVAFNPYSYLYK